MQVRGGVWIRVGARGRLLAAACIGAVALISGSAAAGEVVAPEGEDIEVVDLTPNDPVGVSMRSVTAPFTAVFRGGMDYWYAPRGIRVDTTPSGGLVDLFYVRRNFQKRFEQAETPVIVGLPARIKTGPRDSLTIRAFREGYRQKRVTIPVSSRETSIVINLEPLPNTLSLISHRYFAGRSSLIFLTKEPATVRLQEKRDGFTLILSQTAKSPEAGAALDSIGSPILSGAYAQQLGEDLVITAEFNEGVIKDDIQVRSREELDAARDLHMYTLDIAPKVGSGGAVARAKSALEEVRTADVTGCALGFDSSLREDLGSGDLNRALTPRGAFTDPYLRAAMRRLGEVSPGDGAVDFGGGMSYRPTIPIELEVALSQAGDARGFLSLLDRFVSEMEESEYQRETFRSLIAPELDEASFDAIMDRAQERRKSCLASR